jgi:hypothetical protein
MNRETVHRIPLRIKLEAPDMIAGNYDSGLRSRPASADYPSWRQDYPPGLQVRLWIVFHLIGNLRMIVHFIQERQDIWVLAQSQNDIVDRKLIIDLSLRCFKARNPLLMHLKIDLELCELLLW